MMINIPSAPGGAAAAPGALPGVASGAAALPASSTAEGTVATPADGAGMPALFAQLLDFAGLAQSAQAANAQLAGTQADGAKPADTTETDTAVAQAPADAAMTAMMPALHFAVLPTVQQAAATVATAGAPQADAAGTQVRGATLLGAASDSARQAAADAITAAAAAPATPLAARLLQGVLPAAGEPAAAKADGRQSVTATGNGTPATHTAATAAATVLAAQDGSAQSGKDGQSGQQPGDNGAAFRGVMAASAPAAGNTAGADTVKLVGNPDQWQQPLRAALGDRLQVTLQKGNDQAVIRLEPPNLGSIEISIRQTAGSLHVSMSATNGDVVRQLNAVGDSMRQDLSQRQYGDVAVTVSQSSRSLADSDGRGRQPEREQQEGRGPGRALNEGDDTNTIFAMLRE